MVGKRKDRKLILKALEELFELQLESVRKLIERDHGDGKDMSPRRKSRKSIVDCVVQILTEEGRPLHIDTLVKELKERFGRITDRDSLSSALAKKARTGELICRVAPATFALKPKG